MEPAITRCRSCRRAPCSRRGSSLRVGSYSLGAEKFKSAIVNRLRIALHPEQVVGHLDNLVVGEVLERPTAVGVVHESLDERMTAVPTPCPPSCLARGELTAVTAATTDDRGVRAQTRRMRRRKALAVRIGATCRVRSQFIAIDHASTSSS